ncbi:hypothetical protein [uncultured Prevotella sp.]|nr:hypothetical protein [uncultured Prevotella sp.]
MQDGDFARFFAPKRGFAQSMVILEALKTKIFPYFKAADVRIIG